MQISVSVGESACWPGICYTRVTEERDIRSDNDFGLAYLPGLWFPQAAVFLICDRIPPEPRSSVVVAASERMRTVENRTYDDDFDDPRASSGIARAYCAPE
jgi:hypothetical protein